LRKRDLAKALRLPLGFLLAALYLWLAPRWVTETKLVVGALVALVGLLIRGWASGHIMKNQRLATTGPYAFTRNPLYFGSFLIAVGFAIAAHWSLVLLVALQATVRLDKMVVVGDSVLAGFASGGLIRKGRMGQRDSAPALIARQGGAKLTLPNMSAPGFPPPLVIADRNHNGTLDPGEVRRRAKGIGFRSKPNDDAQNLAVPGERVSTVLDKIRVTDVIGDAIDGDVRGRDVMKAVIVGLPLDDDAQSQITRAQDQHPTLLLVWLGNNDVLGFAVSGSPPNMTSALAGITSNTAFSTATDKLVDSLTKTLPAAKGIIIGVVNVINVPLMFQAKYLFTSVTGNIRATFDAIACGAGSASTTCAGGSVTIDPSCTATSTELIHSALPYAIRANQHPAYVACSKSNPFGAQGVGDAFVLDGAEQTTITTAVTGFNTTLQAKATAKGFAYVDPNPTLIALKTAGTLVRNAPNLTSTTAPFGTGMSFDGVHPAYLAHVEIANAIGAAINAKYGTTLTTIVP